MIVQPIVPGFPFEIRTQAFLDAKSFDRKVLNDAIVYLPRKMTIIHLTEMALKIFNSDIWRSFLMLFLIFPLFSSFNDWIPMIGVQSLGKLNDWRTRARIGSPKPNGVEQSISS